MAAETWPTELSRMPLEPPVTRITWSNAVTLMLPALRSNAVVKAVIFLPGATDEFYLYRRAAAELVNPMPSLLDAVSALTNQSAIRATFQPPLLLLHTSSDKIGPRVAVEDQPTGEKLKRSRIVRHPVFVDRDWDTLQPFLRQSLKLDIRPWRGSKDAWHFFRPCFAGRDLDGLETLETAALATGTKVTVRRNAVLFQPR